MTLYHTMSRAKIKIIYFLICIVFSVTLYYVQCLFNCVFIENKNIIQCMVMHLWERCLIEADIWRIFS